MSKGSKKKELELTIVVDTNDGDYDTSIRAISVDELERIKPLIKAIKNFKPYKVPSAHGSYEHNHDHNYPYGECLREDLGEKSPRKVYAAHVAQEIFDYFEDLLPHNTEYGFHSIISIEVTPLVKKTKLL